MSKVILITGSTDGIGKITALKLAKKGYSIFLHGRDANKLNNVISEIRIESKNQNVNGVVADFANLDSVNQMAEQLKNTLGNIDVLINNAGVYKSKKPDNDYGIDMRFAVNYIAPYVLTNALLPLLKNSSDPRIINLSSAAQSSVILESLSGKKLLTEQNAYAQSKLALTMWSFHLAQLYPDITVIAVNPGSLLNTNMVKEAFGRFWSSAEKGGNILYDLAISNEYATQSGKYFDNDKGELKGAFGEAHPDAYDSLLISKLIDKTESVIAEFAG
ncbi:MAG: SDR family NAD(P)-dependent oxidoreductase [Bacteroidia bacterium]|nr:SDR family NAD(P)-dependent oxidoreductase [Bacteroidia bacterium]